MPPLGVMAHMSVLARPVLTAGSTLADKPLDLFFAPVIGTTKAGVERDGKAAMLPIVGVKATVAQTLANVRNAYWDLVFAQSSVEVARQARPLALLGLEHRGDLGVFGPQRIPRKLC